VLAKPAEDSDVLAARDKLGRNSLAEPACADNDMHGVRSFSVVVE